MEMAERRILKCRSTEEWEEIVFNCLTSTGGDPEWGCLSKQGELFRIKTLDTVQVPMSVVQGMVKKGLIALKTKEPFFEYM